MSRTKKDIENLFELSPEALFLEDSEGNVLDVNQEACKMLGYEKAELIGQDVDWIVPKNAPVYLPGEIDEATRAGEPIETVNLRKDGTEVPVELRGRILEVEGKERVLVSIRDISERRQAKKEHRIVTEGTTEAIYLFQDGEFKFVNEGFEKLSGYSKEELDDIGFLQLVHPDYKERVAKWTQQALTGDVSGLPERVEYKVLTKEGETIWFRSLPSLIEYAGRPAIVGNAVDITAQKEREEALRQYKMAVESSVNLLAAVDENYNYLFANQSYRELYQVRNERIIGKKLKDVVGEEAFKEEIKPHVDRCLQGEKVDYEMSRSHTGEGERVLSITYYPLEREDEIHGAVKVMRDITERKRAERKLKQSEERLELALEGTKAGIWDWNVQTGDVVFNKRWAEIVGYTLEELQPVTIETWEEFTHPEDLKRSEELLERHFNGETEVYECEARMKHKNGDWVWVLDRGRVVEWDEDGRPVRMVGTHQDITERKRAEETLHEERNKLKRLHDAVDKLQQQETEEQVVEAAVEAAEKMLNFELCAILMVQGDSLISKANSTRLDSEEPPRFKVGEGVVGKTVQDSKTIRGDDVRDYPGAEPTDDEFRAFISTPIGEIGTLLIVSKEVASFDDRDVELAEILAGHLREELKRVRLEEDLRQQAIRDPLTNLYNRRYFNETLQKEVKKADRYHKPLAFLMIDVDRFKEINDRYSHQTGDEVLKQVANLLEENVRDADTVVRYGGDEFLVMMPETNGGVTSTVNRLNEELHRWNKRTEVLDFPLTLAMGISHWNPDQDRSVEEALDEADKKMYEDKRR